MMQIFVTRLAWCRRQAVCWVVTIPLIVPIYAGETTTIQDEAPRKMGDIKSLDVYVDNKTVHVLLADYHESTGRSYLRYLTSGDACSTWSKPIRVDQGSAIPYARGRGTDFHLAANGRNLVAVWMTKGTGFMERGPLVSAYSQDGGKSWSPGANPADDGTDGDHSFMDVTSDSEGSFHLVWLDKRSGKEKGLYSARSTDGGQTWAANKTVDSATCDCCWNVLTADRKGNLYTLYRDLKPRDMALAFSEDNGDTWISAGIVGKFNWDFNGCPHVGGAIAVHNRRGETHLHTAIWTGKTDQLGVYYLQALDIEKMEWSSPKRLGTKDARFPDIAVNSNGYLAAVWDDTKDDKTAIFSSTSLDNGDTWSTPRQLPEVGVSPTHARVVAVGDNFHVFWTETGNEITRWNHVSLLARN